MHNILIQPGLFQLKSQIKNKDYQDILQKLRYIDELLITTGIENKYIKKFLNRKLLEKQIINPEIKDLTVKEEQRYITYCSEGIRCNILSQILKKSLRDLSMLLATSFDFRCFIYNGKYEHKASPSKSKLFDFKKLFTTEELEAFSRDIVLCLRQESISQKLGIKEAIQTDVIWSDATCLMSKIHFPVDWLLCRDIVRSLMTTVHTVRKHGIKNRMVITPYQFINNINNFCMQMTMTRRKKEGKKERKKIFRGMKKVCTHVINHAKKHKDLLLETYKTKSDLSKPQVDQFIKRIDNILDQALDAIKIGNKRIISEKKTKSKEKILSLYDDNVSVIVRGKSGAEVEFGNELLLSEQKDGFITHWKLYDSKVSDVKKFDDIMNAMSSNGYAMKTLVTDRGFSSKTNDQKLAKADIYNCILPKNIKLMTNRMRDTEYKALQKRRSQTESRIGIVKNIIGNKMKERSFENKQLHVGWAVLAHNLVKATKFMHKVEKDIKVPLLLKVG